MTNRPTPAMDRLESLLPLNKTVRVRTLFRQMFDSADDWTPTEMQWRLGPYIARLNKRLRERNEKIVPGVERGSYQRVKTKKL